MPRRHPSEFSRARFTIATGRTMGLAVVGVALMCASASNAAPDDESALTPTPAPVEDAAPTAPPKTISKMGKALIAKPIQIVPATSTEKREGVEGIDGLRATFYVGCTPDVTAAMLWDISRFQEIFPDIQRLKVLKRKKTMIEAEFGVDVTVAWINYSLRRRFAPKIRRISWREIGGDLNHVRGEWRIWPTKDPNVSKVRYSSFVEVSAFVPTSMIRDGALGAVRKLPGKVRRGCKTVPQKAAKAGTKPEPSTP